MSGVSVREGVVFGGGGGRDLRCDIYTPEQPEGLAPAVLLVHGGGWRMGERGMMRPYGERLAAAGFVCMASEYRLTPEAAWPAHIEDVNTALRWLRGQAAELGVDPSRIGLQGSSAGAHLVLLAAGTAGRAEFGGRSDDTGVAAVVAIFPPTVFYVEREGVQRPHGGLAARALMGEQATDEAALAASPLTHVAAAFPPTMLLHGTADTVVPVSASIVMYEALVAAQVPVEMHLYAEQPHGFARQPEFVDQVSTEIAGFFKRYLSGVARGEEPQPVAAR